MTKTLAMAAMAALMTITISAQGQDKTPENWHNESFEAKGWYGTSVDRAYAEILPGKTPKKIVVAVIDSGVEYTHEDLSSKLWTNTDEIPGNGIDDDKNGYVDDVHGWSFLGGKDGDVVHALLEFTREYIRLKAQFGDKSKAEISKAEAKDFAAYERYKTEYKQRVEEAEKNLAEYQQLAMIYQYGHEQLTSYFGTEKYTAEEVKTVKSEDEDMQSLIDFMAMATAENLGEELPEAIEHFENTVKYAYNEDNDIRKVVGDNPNDVSEKYYGNDHIAGPHGDHGTHVAGIIGADRTNAAGMKGIAQNAEIMILRAVPDGDERDKDVANAIRYAADNGAQIINMSFGKSISPNKTAVDEAVKYAASKGILLVHAAGNSNKNVDKTDNFPNANYTAGGSCPTWIEVGASSNENEKLAADFSNYGKKSVDLFAPGVDIYSTVPEGKYKENSGTSMAAPVVSGVAALVWGYYPELTAEELKSVLIKSTDSHKKLKVIAPGTENKKVKFKKLCSSAGTINAYNALEMAAEMSTK